MSLNISVQSVPTMFLSLTFADFTHRFHRFLHTQSASTKKKGAKQPEENQI